MSFIYVGRLDELKGIKFLFDTWKMMAEKAPNLIVCGNGPLEKWCDDFLREDNVPIEMKGLIDNNEVRKLMKESEALILPTRWYEGFPMTIVEAYSVGLPVLGSDLGNVGRLIIDGVTGWKFNPSDNTDLINVVRKMIKNPLNRQIIVDYYKENYLDNIAYDSLMKIYSCIEKMSSDENPNCK